jgi:hypothetical protein
MRGYQAATAGQKGQTILTAFTRDNAREPYGRCVHVPFARTGCPTSIFWICRRPVARHGVQKALKDNSRKYMEIFERRALRTAGCAADAVQVRDRATEAMGVARS